MSQRPFGPHEKAIAAHLRDIPIKWFPINWNDLSDAQEDALTHLVTRGFIEAKGYLRWQARGSSEYNEAILISRGFCAAELRQMFWQFLQTTGFLDSDGKTSANILRETGWTHVRLTSKGEETRDKLLGGSITEAEFYLVCWGQISHCEIRPESISSKPGRLTVAASDAESVSKGMAQDEPEIASDVSATTSPSNPVGMPEVRGGQLGNAEAPSSPLTGEMTLPQIWTKYAIDSEKSKSRIRVNLNNAVRNRPGLGEKFQRNSSEIPVARRTAFIPPN